MGMNFVFTATGLESSASSLPRSLTTLAVFTSLAVAFTGLL
jgi:hypothetical protein